EPLAAPIPSAHGPDAPPRRGGTLRLAWFQDIRTLDPAAPSDGYAVQAEHLLFAGLVDFDDRGRIVPELADHWDVADGGRTYRFALRAGVRMHDGEELTADDVKRSAERALHPTTPNPNASYFKNIDGYEAYVAKKADHLRGVAVEGRYVVSFRLEEPDATFLPVLAMHTLRPVCRTAGDRYRDTWLPCGAGPFKLLAGGWQRGLSLRLVRHDEYFRGGLPYLDAVEWTCNMQVAAQRFRFEDGKLDILRDMTQADQARFAADPRWNTLGSAEADRTVLGESMNTRMPPFDHVEIRRAVAAAIDRDHYRAIKPGYMTALTQLLPPGIPGYDPDVHGQRYDYAAALDHMRKAGYPYDPATGKGGWPTPVVYPLYDQGLLVYTAQLLQQDLAKIGLRIELRLLSWPAFLAMQQRPGGAAMSQANWEMDYPDPSSVFDPLFTTESIGPESSYNTAFYSNPRFDDLVARARREADPAQRRALYREANEILCDEAPWAFAFAYHFYDVRQPYVRGFKPHPVWSMDVSRVWLDRSGDTTIQALGGAEP
ncbi:MAG TPA: ABC transporter substrate-binding protein, partial [Polyangiaceae bacterium]|nr:ABC transporter substrate-binding protein [Polyangiaceae bacterium]